MLFSGAPSGKAGLAPGPVGINGQPRTDTSGLPAQSSSPCRQAAKRITCQGKKGADRKKKRRDTHADTFRLSSFRRWWEGTRGCQIFYPLMNFHRSRASPF